MSVTEATSYYHEVMDSTENPKTSERVYQQSALWYGLLNNAITIEITGPRITHAINLRREPSLLKILHSRGICTETVPDLSEQERQALDEETAFPEKESEGAQLLEKEGNLHAEKFDPFKLYGLLRDLQRLTSAGIHIHNKRFLKPPQGGYS